MLKGLKMRRSSLGCVATLVALLIVLECFVYLVLLTVKLTPHVP